MDKTNIITWVIVLLITSALMAFAFLLPKASEPEYHTIYVEEVRSVVHDDFSLMQIHFVDITTNTKYIEMGCYKYKYYIGNTKLVAVENGNHLLKCVDLK